MTAVAEDLGPRGRRRVLIASVVAGGGLAVVAFVALGRLSSEGQLEASMWKPLVDRRVVAFLLGGLYNTVRAAAMAMALALPVGTLLALLRLARSRLPRALAAAYTDFFRAVPLVLLILFCGIGLPRYGLQWSPFWFLVMGLTIYNGAVLGEIFRAGVLSLDPGQAEAAQSLGLGYWQVMLLVVLPQAVRRMLPAVVSQLVTLLKDTSLGVVITYEELLRRGRLTGETFHNLLQAFVAVALVYIVINLALSTLAGRLEVRQRRRLRAGRLQVGGVEDLALVTARGAARVEGPGRDG